MWVDRIVHNALTHFTNDDVKLCDDQICPLLKATDDKKILKFIVLCN